MKSRVRQRASMSTHLPSEDAVISIETEVRSSMLSGSGNSRDCSRVTESGTKKEGDGQGGCQM